HIVRSAISSSFFLHSSPHPPHLHSFPTRRSSDLELVGRRERRHRRHRRHRIDVRHGSVGWQTGIGLRAEQFSRLYASLKARKCGDRKSTRLNSSHLVISYAVFCLKKKKRINKNNIQRRPQYERETFKKLNQKQPHHCR